MIERSFHVNDAEIDVSFQWDNGDASVGIGAGWGEETGAEIKVGQLSTFVTFYVDDREPVENWLVDDIQVTVRDGDRHVYFADLVNQQPPTKATLVLFPEICAAVKTTWEQLQAQEAVENAHDIVYELQAYPPEEQDPAEIEAAGRRYTQLKAEFDARYMGVESHSRLGEAIRRFADRRRKSRRTSDV